MSNDLLITAVRWFTDNSTAYQLTSVQYYTARLQRANMPLNILALTYTIQ